MGDLEQAERYLREHDELQTETSGPWNLYWGRNMHAMLAELRGDYVTAKAINQSVLNSLRSVSFLRGMQYTYGNLARIHFALEEFEEAELNSALSLRISWETGQEPGKLQNLVDIAKAWKAQGRRAEASEAIAAVLHNSGIDQRAILRPTVIREDAETLRSELERELDLDQYQAAWEKGSGEEVDDIVDRILSDLEA